MPFKISFLHFFLRNFLNLEIMRKGREGEEKKESQVLKKEHRSLQRWSKPQYTLQHESRKDEGGL